MSLHSTRENGHFGASFRSVGGVEAKISMPQNIEKYQKKSTLGASISRLLHPYGRETCTKVSILRVLCNNIRSWGGGGTEKSENQNLSPLFCKGVKDLIERVQYGTFYLVYPICMVLEK